MLQVLAAGMQSTALVEADDELGATQILSALVPGWTDGDEGERQRRRTVIATTLAWRHNVENLRHCADVMPEEAALALATLPGEPTLPGVWWSPDWRVRFAFIPEPYLATRQPIPQGSVVAVSPRDDDHLLEGLIGIAAVTVTPAGARRFGDLPVRWLTGRR